jgi:hypothetical protein
MGFWTTLLVQVVIFVLAELLRPKPDTELAKPASLGDFEFPTATEARVVPLLWGTVLMKGPNVTWYGDFSQVSITQDVRQNIFKKVDVTVGFRYFLGVQFALCRGPVDKLLSIRIDDIEVVAGNFTHGQTVTIDCPNLFGGDDMGSGGVSGSLVFYSGTTTQTAPAYLGRTGVATATISNGGTSYLPTGTAEQILTLQGGTFTRQAKVRVSAVSSGVITAVQLIDSGAYTVFPSSPATTVVSPAGGSGATVAFTQIPGFQDVNGVVPTYKKTCHLVPLLGPLYLGNSTNIKPWAFELQRLFDPLGLGTEATINTFDANPANLLYELMTDTEWGLAQATSLIDTVSFSNAGDTLWAEGNGMSLTLTKETQARDFLRLIEEQIDGVVFFNQLSGKWQVNLARGGYDAGTLPLLSASNIIEVESFARGAWADTTNQVSARFVDRADNWKETSAIAQDTANIRILQGKVIPGEFNYPGVKDRNLANQLAWRELRSLSYPLAKAVIVVNRTLYDVQPGQVVAWTYEIAGESFIRMPMRIGDIDYGELADGRIRLSLIEDVFEAQAGSFAPPGDTGWQPPTDTLTPFVYQVAMEAPRAIVLRDPATGGQLLDKLWCGARRAGPEVGLVIVERHAVGAPAGAYLEVGRVFGLLQVGNLSASLARGSGVPLTSLVMAPGPDLQASLEAVFIDSTDLTDVGTNLVNVILVGTEFMLVTSAQTSGANVQLNGVYRGVMDSVQGSWAAGTPVYLLFVSAGLSDFVVPAGNNVDVKLLPFSRSDELADTSATVIAFAMANRVRRPYPPSRISLDGTAWSSSTSMEANGTGPETYAIDVSDIRRRDYRTADEAQALTADASTFFPDFPTVNGTVHKIDVRNDPAGANTLLFTTATFSIAQKDVRRIDILLATDGVLPTTMRFDTFARHTHESVAYDSRDPLRHDFSVTTALTGQFNFTALDTNDISATYTVDAAGIHSFTLSSAFTTGNVEVSINLAAFTTLITAGGTTGDTASLSVSDTIRVRHASTDSGALKQLSMNAPGAGTDGYAILFV